MFSKDYWISSANKLKDVKYLTLLAIFIALKIISGFFSIRIAENLFISISFSFLQLKL